MSLACSTVHWLNLLSGRHMCKRFSGCWPGQKSKAAHDFFHTTPAQGSVYLVFPWSEHNHVLRACITIRATTDTEWLQNVNRKVSFHMELYMAPSCCKAQEGQCSRQRRSTWDLHMASCVHSRLEVTRADLFCG
jgi:hypothetical protein